MRQGPDEAFISEMRALEGVYLRSDDPIERSGFGGGAERWESERRPLTAAIDRAGSFLDVGCANGWLAHCVKHWCADEGIAIEPYGTDIGPELVSEARQLLVDAWAADAWSWQPPRSFTFVYSLLDLAPPDLVGDWVTRLASWVEPQGRLIVGSYGSVSRGVAPDDVGAQLSRAGLAVIGEAAGGLGPVSRFAWAQV